MITIQDLVNTRLPMDVVQVILDYDPRYRQHYESVIDQLKEASLWLKLLSEQKIQTSIQVLVYYIEHKRSRQIASILDFYV